VTRVLVTGAGGFIGSHVVRDAPAAWDVVALSMRPGPDEARGQITKDGEPLKIVLGVAYLGWFAWSVLPNRSWSGMLAYGGTGALLLLGPYIARYVRHLDPSSLRVRLALAMTRSSRPAWMA